MDFPEAIKLEAKRRAHYHCVVCKQSVFLEVHHIVPQEQGGASTIENAAPLCPTCHELYGGNPTKQKFIHEARDFWWEHCAKQAASPWTVSVQGKFDALQREVAEGRRELAEVKQIIVEQLRFEIAAIDAAASVSEVVKASSTSSHISQLEALRRIWPTGENL